MLIPCLVFKEEDGEKTSIGEMLVEKLPVFVQSADLEVQERVSYKKNNLYFCSIFKWSKTRFTKINRH